MFPHATCMLWNKKSPNIANNETADNQNNQWKIVWPNQSSTNTATEETHITAPDVATMETTDSSIYIRLIPNSSNTNISNSNNNNSNSNTISNMNAATTAAATTTVVATTTGQGPRRMSDSDKDRTIFDEFLADENSANPRRRNLCNGRFLTMHKRRRKKLQTRSLTYDQAILDDVLHGQVQCILDQVGNWRFNAFTLETVTGGRSLPVLCVHLFHWYGLLDHFNLDVVRVWKLFSLIEEGYHSINPYHNSIHATDVTQAMHCFLQESKILEHLEPLEIMASLIGAVTHDLDHPGVNQPFLIATSNHLAALYENTSVLENHHWRSAVGCLLESGVAEQINDIRPELEKQISSLILATDITRQQEFINKFKDYLNNDSLDMHNSDHRHFILQIALKCADISNPCRPWDISKKWSHKVCEEFFRQGDFERQLNLPITSLCDRQSTSVPKIQSGFFKFVVTPLMNEWHRFLHTDLSNKMMRHLKFNQNQWESRLEAEIAEETRTEISDAELLDEPDDCFDHRQIEYVVDVDIDIDPDLLDDPADTSGSSEILIPNMRRRSLQVPGYGSFKNNRRHSMPVHSIPKIILQPSENIIQPIRPQESILESDEHRFDNDSLSILSSDSDSPSPRARSLADSAERERPLSAENLLPDLSITSMTNSACAERINYVMHGASSCSNTSNLLSVGTSKHLIRQQTFPPLQAYARTRYLSSTAELGACPEALLESNSSSSNESGADTDNRRVLLNKKDSFKRDPTDLYLCDNKSSKFAKLSVVIGTGQKENLDPSILRRSLSRRRGSAPVTVAIPPKSVGSGAAGDGSDVAVSYMLKTEYISLNTRDSITQHIQVVTSGNNNNSNNHNNNSSSNSNNNNNQRRGSVPCDNSSNSVLFRTNNLNSKRRNNTKKNYHRRFSGGAEILGPMRSEILEQQQQQSSNNNCSSSSTSGGPGGNGAGNGTGSGTSSSAWYRFKREISRRTDVETLLTKRRGSLPVEVLTVNYSGTLRH